jgi:hypothetical protein
VWTRKCERDKRSKTTSPKYSRKRGIDKDDKSARGGNTAKSKYARAQNKANASMEATQTKSGGRAGWGVNKVTGTKDEIDKTMQVHKKRLTEQILSL